MSREIAEMKAALAAKPSTWSPTDKDIDNALAASADCDTRKMSFHHWRTLRVAAAECLHYREAQEMREDWQPMETAPEGIEVWVAYPHPDGHCTVFIATKDQRGWDSQYHWRLHGEPVGWMHTNRPSPPARQEGATPDNGSRNT